MLKDQEEKHTIPIDASDYEIVQQLHHQCTILIRLS